MQYSKISSVELTNFMSFKKAKVVFDESGILNIKGYNDSGKSAILRGIAVCLMDMFKRSQAKFISHGEEYFRIVITFNDGVSVLRDKYINGQSLYEVYKDQRLLFTTKQGNKLSKIDGVPTPIADYLGLCVTDSVCLNYQSCIDKLPVVDTTGSENYQMFHEVLRMEEIYKASNIINADKNDLGLDISTMEWELQGDEVLLNRCGDVTQEFIDDIEKLENKSIVVNNKRGKLEDIHKILEEYSKIKALPKIEKISTDRLSRVQDIGRVTYDLGMIKALPKIEKISVDRIVGLYGIGRIAFALDKKVTIPLVEKIPLGRLGSLYSLVDKVDKLQKHTSFPEIPEVSKTLLMKRNLLGDIVKVYLTLEKHANVCSGIDLKLGGCQEGLSSLVLEAKKQGLELVKCENCGCYTEAGGHIHE